MTLNSWATWGSGTSYDVLRSNRARFEAMSLPPFFGMGGVIDDEQVVALGFMYAASTIANFFHGDCDHERLGLRSLGTYDARMLDYINPRIIVTYDFLRSNRVRFASLRPAARRYLPFTFYPPNPPNRTGGDVPRSDTFKKGKESSAVTRSGAANRAQGAVRLTLRARC